jgi:hypothetical protein
MKSWYRLLEIDMTIEWMVDIALSNRSFYMGIVGSEAKSVTLKSDQLGLEDRLHDGSLVTDIDHKLVEFSHLVDNDYLIEPWNFPKVF